MTWSARQTIAGSALWVALLAVACSLAPPAPAATVVRAAPTATRVAPTATPPLATNRSVYIDAAEQYFYPESVTVPVGTTVVWRDVQGTHDMVADDRSFASAVLFEGGTYSFTFSQPGTYRYVCTLHVGAGMWAEVQVQ